MNNIIKILKEFNKELKSKTYWCDYIDKQNNCFNNQFIVFNPEADDNQATKFIYDELAKQDYAVYSIFEIAEGHTKEEVEKMLQLAPDKIKEFARPIYLDKRILKQLGLLTG